MGVTMAREDRVRDAIVKGELVPALEEFSTPFPGYYLYYPQRRHASPALRAFVDYLRRARHEGHAKRGRGMALEQGKHRGGTRREGRKGEDNIRQAEKGLRGKGRQPLSSPQR
jgi:LysR substrate binding domain-containing protein